MVCDNRSLDHMSSMAACTTNHSFLQSDTLSQFRHTASLSYNDVTHFITQECHFYYICLVFWCNSPPSGPGPSSFSMFLDHTQRSSTVGRTPLDEWSASRRDLYLTAHNIQNRQTFMTPVGFEPTVSAGERPQTDALDRAAVRTGFIIFVLANK